MEAEVGEEEESFLGEDAKRIVSKQRIPRRSNIHTCTSDDQVRVELLHCTASTLVLTKKRDQLPTVEMEMEMEMGRLLHSHEIRH